MLLYLPDPAALESPPFMFSSGGATGDGVELKSKKPPPPRVLHVFESILRAEALRIFDRHVCHHLCPGSVAVLVALWLAGALLALVIVPPRELACFDFLAAAQRAVRKRILFDAGLLGRFVANLCRSGLGFWLCRSSSIYVVISSRSVDHPVATAVSSSGALTSVSGATVLAGFYYPAAGRRALEPARGEA